MSKRPVTISDRLRTVWRHEPPSIPTRPSTGLDRGEEFAARLREAVARKH